jgi:ribosomal protein L35
VEMGLRLHVLPQAACASLCREFSAKTKSGASKRFRLRNSGSVKRWQEGRRHNTGPKASSVARRLGNSITIAEGKILKRVKTMLGVWK